ncbi:MAG TPA: metallophosphoesterase [Methylomirabilota bacterium]|nr:metallophosphoesterase [Methylomirabilota bacterium]
MTRREALRRLSAGALLAGGAWPGALRAADNGRGGEFRFLVVNDTHCMSPECRQWLDRAVSQMRTEQAAFCLLAGDLTEHGEEDNLAAVRDVFGRLGVPLYVQIGNHDYAAPADRSAYERIFPGRINYAFHHAGWQFLGLDTTEGRRYEQTTIADATLRWLDDQLPRLDREQPTVIFTHFPLGAGVTYRPRNADALLERFLPFNLQAVFSGHFHGFTERTFKSAAVTTNRCCALKRGNHDGSREKGYFVCTAAEGRVTRRFVELSTALDQPSRPNE